MIRFRDFFEIKIQGKNKIDSTSIKVYITPLIYNNFSLNDTSRNAIKELANNFDNSFIDLELLNQEGNVSSNAFCNIITAGDSEEERYSMIVTSILGMVNKALEPLKIRHTDVSRQPKKYDNITYHNGIECNTITYDGETIPKCDYFFHNIEHLTDDELKDAVDYKVKNEQFLTQFLLYFDDKEIGYVIETFDFTCEFPSKLKYLVDRVGEFDDLDITGRLFGESMKNVCLNVTKKQISDISNIGIPWEIEVASALYREMVNVLLNHQTSKISRLSDDK